MAGEAMLTAALPVMSNEFDVPGVFESWILPMVLLVGTAAAPFIGVAGDQYGRRKLLLLCLVLYLCGLVCGYLAWNIVILLFSRSLQGIGLASFPLAYALIRDQLPLRKAAIGIGLISAMYGAGLFIGVIAGSFIVELFSWRMTFLALIPVTVFLMFLAMFCIHDKQATPAYAREIPVHLDWFGFITLLSACFLCLFTISLGDGGAYGSLPRVLSGGGAIIAGILFIRTELTVHHPLVDLHLAGSRTVLLLIVIGILTNLAFLMLLQEMPFLIQSETGLGLTAASVGLILMPGTLCDMMTGPLTGRLIAGRGVRLPCVTGSFFMAGAVLGLLTGSLSFLTLGIAWMIISAGMSMILTSCTIAMINHVPSSRTAEATGLIQSVQTIGGMAGPVLTGLVLAGSSVTSLRDGVAWALPAPHAFTQVHGIVLLVCIVILLCSLCLKPGSHMNDFPGLEG
jgi:MFS family permease